MSSRGNEERGGEGAQYRQKAAHMRKLAEQAQNETARTAYVALEGSWLKLAEKTEEFSSLTHGAENDQEEDEDGERRSA
jgi:hypothetical protein